MKIVMVTNVVAPDKLGGLERYVRELSVALVQRGHDVSVVSKRTHGDQPSEDWGADGVHIIRVSPPSKKNPFFALLYPIVIGKSVLAAVKRERATTTGVVVHGHFPVPMLPLALRRVPYIYTCHAPVYQELLAERQGSYRLPYIFQRVAVWGLRRVEGIVIRRAAHVITLSRFIENEVAVLDDTAPRRLTVIPGGLDTSKFRPFDAGHHAKRPGPVLFTARRLVSRTGVEELIAAMPYILRELPRAQLFVAGEGTRRAMVEAAINRHGLGESVELLGRISDAELVARYQGSDIAITPTQHLEGFGLSTAEALACGTPAIVTPVGANAEVIGQLSKLLVCADKSPQSIARAVVDLWRNQPSYLTIRARARDQIHPAMGWHGVAAQHESLYARTPGLSGKGPQS